MTRVRSDESPPVETAGTDCWFGVDEAGYGPRLGPLVQAAAWRNDPSISALPDHAEDILAWVEQKSATIRQQAQANNLPLGDSKNVYKPKDGPGNLWRTILTLTAPSPAPTNGTTSPFPIDELTSHSGEHGSSGLDINAWREPKPPETNTGLDPMRLHGVCLHPRRYNEFETTGNKADVNWSLTRHLVKPHVPCWRKNPSRVVLTLDRQGGRKYYTGCLSDLLSPGMVQAIEESRKQSIYRVQLDESILWVIVRVNCESWSAVTALASMAAKAVRESAMQYFNRHFQAQYPGLATTAGYAAHAVKWKSQLQQLAESTKQPQPPWEQIWRNR